MKGIKNDFQIEFKYLHDNRTEMISYEIKQFIYFNYFSTWSQDIYIFGQLSDWLNEQEMK